MQIHRYLEKKLKRLRNNYENYEMITKTTILFGNRLKADVLKCDEDFFVQSVNDVSLRLEIVPHWLMGVMELETAGTFDPSITNSLGYTGLIQFGKVAAVEVGSTTDKLRKMDACCQLFYVEKYLAKFKGKMNSFSDVYLAVFFPLAMGKPDGWVLQAKGLDAARVAKWNSGFDIDKDRQIQVWEIKHKLNQRLPKNFKWLK